ncbi:hypothetical protein [Bremerella cremea]|uniref:hypothetical protein n=1 Tax=Bremerella cremea TaxID=1031537 RepID=UPI0031E8859E
MIRWKSEDWAFVEQYQLLREIESAGSANCCDCSRRYEVEYISDRGGGLIGYINCGDCGLERVHPDRLKRWEIDTTAMLRAFFGGLNLALDEQVPNCLWKIGRANWAGYSRYVWFVRSFSSDQSDAVEILKRNKKAIVFAPNQSGSTRWHEVAGNLVIPLEGATWIEAGRLILDIEEIEGRIDQAGLGAKRKKIRPIRKRAVKTRKIEMLTKELIRFLRDARDHAFSTLDANGAAEQLPRPTRKELGELAGLEPYDVTRCFDDTTARELRLYWEVADDLEQIMKFRSPISSGAQT